MGREALMSRDLELRTYLAETRAQVFRPGRFDCALFAAEWVRRVSGLDLADGWRGKYRSLDEGRKMIEAKGFASHVDMAAAELLEVPVAQARVGDVAVVDELAFGIVSGERIFVLRLDGLGSVPLLQAERMFRP